MSAKCAATDCYTFYSLINRDNGRRYIGRSKQVDKRINQHLSAIKSKRHPNPYIMEDADDTFDYEILETGIYTLHDSMVREQAYMVEYKTYDPEFGYNVDDRGMQAIKKKRIKTKTQQIPDYGMDEFLFMHLFINADKRTQELIRMMVKQEEDK